MGTIKMPEEKIEGLNSYLPVDRITERLNASADGAKLDTRPVDFFVHDGSAGRPANIGSNLRVLYIHKKDGAFVVTNSDKLRSWADVTLYLPLGYSQLRIFARSKSPYAR